MIRASRSAMHLPNRPRIQSGELGVLSTRCSKSSLLAPRKSMRDYSTDGKDYFESMSTAASVRENEQIDKILQGRKSPIRPKSPYGKQRTSRSPTPTTSPVRRSPSTRSKSSLIRRLDPAVHLRRNQASVEAEYLVSSSADRTSRVEEESPTLSLLAKGNSHRHAIADIGLLGGNLLTVSLDYCGGVWSVPIGQDRLQGRLTKPLHKAPVHALAIAGSRVVTGSADSTIRVWDPGLSELSRTITVQNEVIRCLIEVEGRNVMSAGSGARLHDLETGQCIRVFEASKCRGVFALHRVNWEMIATGGGDGVVQVWDSRDTNASISFHSHTERINSLCSFESSLYSASDDCTVRLFDLRRPSIFQVIPKSHPVTALAMIGSRLLACSSTVELEGWRGGLELNGRVKVAKYWEERKWLTLGDGQGELRVYHVR